MSSATDEGFEITPGRETAAGREDGEDRNQVIAGWPRWPKNRLARPTTGDGDQASRSASGGAADGDDG
jgi:hypothetical protein